MQRGALGLYITKLLPSILETKPQGEQTLQAGLDVRGSKGN